jgi:hypothetical protein
MLGGEDKESRWAVIMQRSSGLVDRFADSVKEVGRGTLLKQGLDAQERGNIPAAFWLLYEAFRDKAQDNEICMAFWDVASDYGRPGEAVAAAVQLVETLASEGQFELACQYWSELVAFDPTTYADPAALTRIFPSLGKLRCAQDSELEIEEKTNALLAALRAIVDERNHGLTTTVAFRVTELARNLDTDITLNAAAFCLRAKDIHVVKRKHLVALVRELDPNGTLQIPEYETLRAKDLARAQLPPNRPVTNEPARPLAARIDASEEFLEAELLSELEPEEPDLDDGILEAQPIEG